MINPYYSDETVTLFNGDCRDIMEGQLPDNSVDSIVTDPPYELGFMGKKWDNSGIAYNSEVWENAYRILKPGGHLLAFGGTRTWHRLAVAIEDAGFEVRDSIAWMYGSGFPKSLDVSKAIDKAAGATGTYGAPKSAAHAGWIDRGKMRGDNGDEGYQRPWMDDPEAVDKAARKYEPGSPAAQQWQGWGTALKPAFEPIVVARKPLIGTVAENVLAHGTGGLNIDGCRIAGDVPSVPQPSLGVRERVTYGFGTGRGRNGEMSSATTGRWPANVILDESQAAELDKQSGVQRDGVAVRHRGVKGGEIGAPGAKPEGTPDMGYGGEGGASRFFYCAKAGKKERPNVDGVAHPTVKPVSLMRYLVRLVTPPGGIVIDPFAGSGTTIEAAMIEGFNVIGIEMTEEYLPLIVQRITKPTKFTLL